MFSVCLSFFLFSLHNFPFCLTLIFCISSILVATFYPYGLQLAHGVDISSIWFYYRLLALGLMEYNTDWKAIQQRFLPCKSKHQVINMFSKGRFFWHLLKQNLKPIYVVLFFFPTCESMGTLYFEAKHVC